MASIRVYHAFRSPYSRLGLHIVSEAGLPVEVIPFTGPPEGVPFQDPVANKPKRAYYMQDIPRMTMRLGLSISLPDPFDVDFTEANRALAAAEEGGFGLAYGLAVSNARWGRGENVSDRAVLERCAEEVGWSAAAVAEAQTSSAVDERLAAAREAIEKDGVFGVPFAVNGPAKYWGHERFQLLVEEAVGSQT
ncbi:MAG: DsbA family protein [Pseudomonadota bacterium]